MKILYILNSLALWGGGERILTEKMNYLNFFGGYDINVITINQGNKPYSYNLNKTINNIDLNIQTNIQYKYKYPYRFFIKIKIGNEIKKKLKQQIEIIQPDIICCLVDDYVDIIMKTTKIPLVVESHNLKVFTRTSNREKRTYIQSFLRKKYFKKISKAEKLVCITNGDAEDWKSIKCALIIPNCINYNIGDLSTCKNKRVILVGRLAYQKGIDSAIKIWKIVNQKHSDWELHIYGEGELKKNIERWIYDSKLDKSVYLHNPTSNIFEEYRNCSISICTSRYEAFGLVIAEAMSCGVPCISSNCPYGPAEIIHDGDDGYLINLDSKYIDTFAKKIIELIENEISMI